MESGQRNFSSGFVNRCCSVLTFGFGLWFGWFGLFRFCIFWFSVLILFFGFFISISFFSILFLVSLLFFLVCKETLYRIDLQYPIVNEESSQPSSKL